MMSKAEKQAFIGLMSGTSLDGVDAVLVEFTSANHFELIETYFEPYTDSLRGKIHDTAQHNQNLFHNEDSPLNSQLAPVYAGVCEKLITKSGYPRESICGIANHGQTVKHEPAANPPYSLQLGDAQLITAQTGIDVYSQFRQGDLAVGGQGAPLMPAFHHAWLNESIQNTTTFVLNIGGIANISMLSKNEATLGFDTGPGNVLMDQWIEEKLGETFDENGQWAKTGAVNETLLEKLFDDPYFTLPPPKSTGTDYFNLEYLSQKDSSLNQYSPEDVQATLLELTARSIANDIKQLSISGTIFVCGGGTRNLSLLKALKTQLADFEIKTTDSVGIPSDWVEAVGFAWLGYCCKNKIESNIPSVTGAHKAVVLGEFFSNES